MRFDCGHHRELGGRLRQLRSRGEGGRDGGVPSMHDGEYQACMMASPVTGPPLPLLSLFHPCGREPDPGVVLCWPSPNYSPIHPLHTPLAAPPTASRGHQPAHDTDRYPTAHRYPPTHRQPRCPSTRRSPTHQPTHQPTHHLTPLLTRPLPSTATRPGRRRPVGAQRHRVGPPRSLGVRRHCFNLLCAVTMSAL